MTDHDPSIARYVEIERRIDPDAVTDTRHIPRKLSDNCYVTPDACHWCREAFRPGQMRYPVLAGVNFGTGWEIVSVCMDCFKAGDESNITKLERFQRECAGCGEPMLTPVSARRGQWHVCSNRCYQRDYRKRRRGQESVIPWKASYRSCEACKKPLGQKRAGARFCGNRCRQWHYRQRKRP